MQEAEALTRITHPGIVRVIDRDRTDNGKPFFVMEFVKGKPLRSIIAYEGLDFEYAAFLIREIGQALYAAHREGVFHRDLKPENIMLETHSDGDEHVKLIDFGIAKVRDSDSGATTEMGVVAGSLNYMAPEQLLGQQVSAASDIYAFATIAYELLTGRRPFNIDSPNPVAAAQQLMVMQRSEQILSPQQLRPSLSAAAQNILLGGLRYEPNLRPNDARQFAEELAHGLAAGNSSTQPTILARTQVIPATPSLEIGAQGTAPQLVLDTQREEPAPTSQPQKRGWTFSFGLSGRRLRLQLVIGTVAAMLLVAVVSTTVLFRSRGSIESSRPSGTSTASPAAAPLEQRKLVYSIELQKDPRRYPGSKPFQLPGEVVFSPGDRVRFTFSSPQTGWLYVINESPPLGSGTTAFNALFPSPTSNSGSAKLESNERVQIPARGEGFVFDAEQGAEKLWIVWSGTPIDQLEALKRWMNAEDKGEIKDESQIEWLRNFLSTSGASAADAQRNDDTRQTTVTGRRDPIVKLIKLEHY